MIYKEKLKFLREEKGLTQKEIASILNIYKGVYNEYENEYNIIPLKHLNTLCNYFHVSFDFIFCFSDYRCYNNYLDEINVQIAGERIKQFRKENKITQVQLAKMLNTVQPVIANYEKGKFLIAAPFLYTICKKYNASADYLLGKIDSPKYLK